MRYFFLPLTVILMLSPLAFGTKVESALDLKKGRKLFLRHCNFCHPQGRNTIRPHKNLKRSTLIANGIKSPEDIVKLLRNPGPGMPVFSKKRLPDEDARAIAHYVWETFKD